MLKDKMSDNYVQLKNNEYPGRGIIIGMSPDGKNMIQVYWIMGRSENSRNRTFERDNGFVRTKAFDESKMKDPSLVIYYPMKYINDCHIITNGDQTDTIYDALQNGGTFEDALNTRCYEPDPPNFTPRISGIVYLNKPGCAYSLSILKSFWNEETSCLRNYYNYEKAITGVGHCIHTYDKDGSPLPSFSKEPYELELFDDITETIHQYWSALNEENRVSIMAKYINISDGSYNIKIINKN